MRFALTLVLAAAALAACHPTAQDSSGRTSGAAADSPPDLVEPASAPAPVQAVNEDFSGPLQAAGTEPFWGLSIRPDGLILVRPDRDAVQVANPGPVYDGKAATWTAPGLKATLTQAHCNDGMADRDYPYEATVVVGAETLKGCARSVK